MSFSSTTSERFAKVFDKSKYVSKEPIVKIQYIQKGNNIIFGRSIKEKNISNLVYIGKILENTIGKNYLSADCWLDVSFPHVIYITGTRGSGKSFDLGVLLEGICELVRPSNIQSSVNFPCAFLIDTQSQFWTLEYEPSSQIEQNRDQLEDLKKWNIRPNALSNCNIFIPPNAEKITGREKHFYIDPSKVTQEEWCALIKEDVYSPQGYIIGKAIDKLSGKSFDLEDMITTISSRSDWRNVQDSSRNALIYKLENFSRTSLFSKKGINVRKLLIPGACNIYSMRDLRDEDKSLVTGIITRNLFTIMGEYHKKLKIDNFFNKEHDSEKLPSKVWLMIDEAHVIAPSEQYSPAKSALIEYVKRGRDAGLSLILATQQPSAIDDRILSQVNITFSHRLSFQNDITASVHRIPTKRINNLKFSGIEINQFGDVLRYLDAGECFVGDHNTSRTVMLKIRPRVTSHGGYNPV